MGFTDGRPAGARRTFWERAGQVWLEDGASWFWIESVLRDGATVRKYHLLDAAPNIDGAASSASDPYAPPPRTLPPPPPIPPKPRRAIPEGPKRPRGRPRKVRPEAATEPPPSTPPATLAEPPPEPEPIPVAEPEELPPAPALIEKLPPAPPWAPDPIADAFAASVAVGAPEQAPVRYDFWKSSSESITWWLPPDFAHADAIRIARWLPTLVIGSLSTRLLEHRLLVRRDWVMVIQLPADLSVECARRMGRWLVAIADGGPLEV